MAGVGGTLFASSASLKLFSRSAGLRSHTWSSSPAITAARDSASASTFGGKYLAPGGTKPHLSYSRHRDVKTKGRGSCRRTRMRRPTLVPPHGIKFPLTLADGLRATFDDAVSIPLPPRLAALLRRLTAGGNNRSGEDHGARATETSSHIGRRRRR